MTVHVVRPGESVWSIASQFGVSPDDIIGSNEMSDSTPLVVGQTLIIPTKEVTYVVRMGDSLYSIAEKFDVSMDSISKLNNIPSPNQIYPGMSIRIPQEAKKYGTIEVNAFIQPTTVENETKVLKEAIGDLTYLSPFSYHVNKDASLTPIDDEFLISEAKKNGVAPMLVVSNISGANFDTELINNILTNDSLQNTLIENILSTIETKGYYGVIIDFERISPEHRENYNEFLRKLVNKLHPKYIVATALAPKTYDITSGSWHGAHDYKAHGEIVDFVIIMTYEWGWSGGPPMAVAPINEVKKVIDYAVTVIPKNKIMMGMPMYGYDWTLPYIPKGEFAESVGNQEAIERAATEGAQIKYDDKSQSPFYNYVDKDGKEHVVWFEDARSVMAKYMLVYNYGLRGVSYWALGKVFPQNWRVLENMFNIKKVV